MPPSQQKIGNIVIGQAGKAGAEKILRYAWYTRGLPSKQIKYVNKTNNSHLEQVSLIVGTLLVSSEVGEGHFRSAAESNRLLHHRVDRWADNKGSKQAKGGTDLDPGDSDSELNSRVTRFGDSFEYRHWDSEAGGE